MSRREFEMTEAQHTALLDACKPTPVMFLSGGEPMHGTPQSNANAAWQALGREMGFVWDTVQPVAGKGERVFSAEPVSIKRQYLIAKFHSSDRRGYTYHNDGPPVAAGDQVKVPDRSGDGWTRVTVHEIEVPKPTFETKAILGLVPPAPPQEEKLL